LTIVLEQGCVLQLYVRTQQLNLLLLLLLLGLLLLLLLLLQGWCTVERPRVSCSCDLDGYDGALCDAVTETV
jgi:hypothetical protein